VKLRLAGMRRAGGPLSGAAASARARYQERHGILLSIADDAGHVGHGEASPLPGYSPDALCDVCDALASKQWLPSSLEPDAPLLELLAACSERLPRSLPAARFAAETAMVDLLGQRQQRPAWQLLREARGLAAQPGPVALTWLIQAADAAAALLEVRRELDRGIASFKMKVAGPSLTAESLDRLHAVREALGDQPALRLDANGSLCPATASATLQQLAVLRPEFVEQPTPNPEQLVTSPVPLALDESLQHACAAELLPTWVSSAPIQFLVLKPMALGGLHHCLQLAAAARALGLAVVVSHLLDGPIALSACCALALAIDQPPLAAGLGRHPGLSAWPAIRLVGLSATHVVPWSQPGLGIQLGAPGPA
jgi:o-succinylbenzoate synthase